MTITKEQLSIKLQEINQQIQQLHDEGMGIVGQIKLLEAQAAEKAVEAKTTETPK